MKSVDGAGLGTFRFRPATDVAAGLEWGKKVPADRPPQALFIVQLRRQISRLYSAMVRSLEKNPHRAVFTSIFRAQKGLSP